MKIEVKFTYHDTGIEATVDGFSTEDPVRKMSALVTLYDSVILEIKKGTLHIPEFKEKTVDEICQLYKEATGFGYQGIENYSNRN